MHKRLASVFLGACPARRCMYWCCIMVTACAGLVLGCMGVDSETQECQRATQAILSSLKELRMGMTEEEMAAIRPNALPYEDSASQPRSLQELEELPNDKIVPNCFSALYMMREQGLDSASLKFQGRARVMESITPMVVAWCEEEYEVNCEASLIPFNAQDRGRVYRPTLTWEKKDLFVRLIFDRNETAEGPLGSMDLSIYRNSSGSPWSRPLYCGKGCPSEEESTELFRAWGLESIFKRQAERKRAERKK